jgi:O-antigen/teichoic acid export membrane protein
VRPQSDGSHPERPTDEPAGTRPGAGAIDGGTGSGGLVRGVRWSFWLNVVTLPMSFVTNLVLGRASAEVLGLYGAIQVFVAGFQTFLIFGGNAVFTRFVPAMSRERRFPFLLSYLALALGIVGTAWSVAMLFARAPLDRLLARFGAPAPGIALGVMASVVVWAFCSHFLYGVERAPRAAVALKSVVVGYFVLALCCGTALGPSILAAPARSLWIATVIAYAGAAFLAAAFVIRLDATALELSPGWFLPAGFAAVVVYTHLGTVVEFVYSSLSPSMVLVWLDTAALGRLTAALRWVVLVALLPGMLVTVVAPRIARLDAEGKRDEALRRAQSSVRLADLAVAPSVLALIAFAPQLMGVFGEDYRPYAGLLRLAALSALAGPTVYIGGGVAIALGALRPYLIASIAYVVASVGLNLAFIPRYGLAGAAAATALSSAVQGLAVGTAIRRLGYQPPRTTVLGAIAGAIAFVLARAFAPSLLAAAGGWLALSVLYAWAAGVTPGEARRLAMGLVGSRS